MIVIGGGVIGLELGQVYRRLGRRGVSNRIHGQNNSNHGHCPKQGADEGYEKTRGIKFFLSHRVSEVSRQADQVTVLATDKKDKQVTFTGDYCLVSV